MPLIRDIIDSSLKKKLEALKAKLKKKEKGYEHKGL